MTRQKRFLSMLLATMLAFAVLFSAAYIAEETVHDCTGAGCTVCRQLSICENLLKAAGGATLAAVAAAAVFFRVCAIALPRAGYANPHTLISLKVKLSN